MASIANGLIEYIKTDNGIHAIASSAYGVCDDLASTQIKTVNIPGFELEEGVTIHVKFENGNTAANPKLNINNHENENIDIESVGGVPINTLELGAMLTLTYDGTAWVKDYGGTGSGGNISEYDSDNETPSTDDGSLTWISRVTQNEDGSIATERTTLDVIPIANGGTGASTFNGDEVIVSDSTGETLTSVPYSDNTTGTAQLLDNTSTNFVTERYIYYGLPQINDDHQYDADTSIFVPLSSGTEGQLLISGGNNSEPQWAQNTLLMSTDNGLDDVTGLLLGNNTHAGLIGLYATTGVHVFSINKPANPTFDNTPIEHTFPSTQGYIVQSSGLGAGNFESPIYLENGIIQESLPIILKWNFTIASGQRSATLSNLFFNAHTYVTQIVVDQGIENLNGPIDWTSSDATEVEGTPVPGNITLTTTTTSGAVSGYILISRGNDVPNT